MSSMTEARNAGRFARPEWSPGQVIGGVDTHKHVHVAAACDGLGAVLGTKEFPTNTAGHRQLRRYLTNFGEVAAVGIEGTGPDDPQPGQRR